MRSSLPHRDHRPFFHDRQPDRHIALTFVKEVVRQRTPLCPERFEGETTVPQEEPPTVADAGSLRVPAMQRLLDNPFLLLFLGVTVPAVIYLVWGLMEISQIPIAK